MLSGPMELTESVNSATVYFNNILVTENPTYSITVVKTSTGFDAITGDFEFTLFKDSVSQGTGSIAAPSGSYTFTGLEPGSYTVEETGALGSDGTTWSFTIDPSAVDGDSDMLSGPMELTESVNSAIVYFNNILVSGGIIPPSGPSLSVAGILITEDPQIEEAGISEEPKIEVAGISNLPFTGQNSYLAIFGSIMLALGISMVTLLVLKKRKPNLFSNLYSRFSFLKKN